MYYNSSDSFRVPPLSLRKRGEMSTGRLLCTSPLAEGLRGEIKLSEVLVLSTLEFTQITLKRFAINAFTVSFLRRDLTLL